MDKKAVFADVVSPARTKGFLAAGKTPVEVYALYTQKLQETVGMTPEVLAELQREVKGLIALTWPEVRLQVLTQWGAERADMKAAQKIALGTIITPAVAANRLMVVKFLKELGDAKWNSN